MQENVCSSTIEHLLQTRNSMQTISESFLQHEKTAYPASADIPRACAYDIGIRPQNHRALLGHESLNVSLGRSSIGISKNEDSIY